MTENTTAAAQQGQYTLNIVILAAARDAHVKLEALADLSGHFKTELSPHSFVRIKRLLGTNCRKQQAELSRDRATKEVERLLKKFSDQVGSVKLAASGWAAIGPGIKRSYRGGRRGYRLAKETAMPEHLHQWRKRVKDLLYQIGLLCPIWPEQMKAVEAELKRLGECLGEDHDLFLLTEKGLMEQFGKEDEREAETLKTLADERQRDLRDQAVALGARFYQEKPSAFCKRIGQYWKRWRCEQMDLARVK